MKVSSTASMTRLNLRMPARIGGAEIVDAARLGPGLADPVLLLDMADEVQHPAGRDEIMDEVPAWAEKSRRIGRNVAHLLHRDQPAIGAAGEARALRAEQCAPHRRKDAVGGDQHIGFDLGAVLELYAHGLAVLLDADAAVREMHVFARHRPGQQRMQFAAMENVCGAPNSFSISVASRALVSVRPSSQRR